MDRTNVSFGKWQRRFIDLCIAGLYGDPRPDKSRTGDDERVAHVVLTTLRTKPPNGSTQWNVRTAAAADIPKTSMRRYLQIFGVPPYRADGFKLCNGPFFIRKLRDAVGLQLAPPDNPLMMCVNEKSQRWALEGTEPMLSISLGHVESVMHYFTLNRTTTLLMALNVLYGAVFTARKPHHRHQEFPSFLRDIDKAVPAELDIHCIAGNCVVRNRGKVNARLAARPR